MQPRLFHLHALSALHCGTGQSADAVDLPIARARATKLPIVPGSSLRGVLRQHVEEHAQERVVDLFGPRNAASAGALAITDAHLLTLPVRCLAGIVSYVTSPFILRRYAQELARAGVETPPLIDAPDGSALVPPESVNILNSKVVLEDLDLSVEECRAARCWADRIAHDAHPDDADARSDFARRFAIVPDSIMSFLAETATEIRARIAIDENTGTVRPGALWYEENLPADSVLWGVFALAVRPGGDGISADQLASGLPAAGTVLQLGGNAGIGAGLVRFLSGHPQAAEAGSQAE